MYDDVHVRIFAFGVMITSAAVHVSPEPEKYAGSSLGPGLTIMSTCSCDQREGLGAVQL